MRLPGSGPPGQAGSGDTGVLAVLRHHVSHHVSVRPGERGRPRAMRPLAESCSRTPWHLPAAPCLPLKIIHCGQTWFGTLETPLSWSSEKKLQLKKPARSQFCPDWYCPVPKAHSAGELGTTMHFRDPWRTAAMRGCLLAILSSEPPRPSGGLLTGTGMGPHCAHREASPEPGLPAGCPISHCRKPHERGLQLGGDTSTPGFR